MTSKQEQKEAHHTNGVVLPIVSGSIDCLSSPDREHLVESSEFLGPEVVGVEVVVIESRANAKGVREEDALLENGSQTTESDDTSTDRGPEPSSPLKETAFSIGLQVLFPFLLAGFGTVAAGMVLDMVQVRPWHGLLRYHFWTCKCILFAVGDFKSYKSLPPPGQVRDGLSISELLACMSKCLRFPSQASSMCWSQNS